jgi:hypothetical protein
LRLQLESKLLQEEREVRPATLHSLQVRFNSASLSASFMVKSNSPLIPVLSSTGRSTLNGLADNRSANSGIEKLRNARPPPAGRMLLLPSPAAAWSFGPLLPPTSQ